MNIKGVSFSLSHLLTIKQNKKTKATDNNTVNVVIQSNPWLLAEDNATLGKTNSEKEMFHVFWMGILAFYLILPGFFFCLMPIGLFFFSDFYLFLFISHKVYESQK